MIEYVKGELTEITPASAVVECGGVGYMLNISLNTYTRLQNERQAKVYVYEAIREDAHCSMVLPTGRRGHCSCC